MKAGIILVLATTLCTACVNLANQQARAYYPKYEHLSESEHNFEQFWNHYKDRYAFFESKGVNWDSVYQKYRPLVDESTTEEELINIFAQMVTPLKDGHICICRKGERLVQLDQKLIQSKATFPYLKSNSEDEANKRDTFWNNVEQVLIQSGFAPLKQRAKDHEGQYTFNFTTSDALGYIHLLNFYDHRTDFDEILRSLSDKKGLIIDIRFNPGGSVGYEMAGRFCKSKKQTHYKVLKNKSGYDGFSNPKPYYVKPEGERYLKPIVILVNDATGSAAEDFTLSLSLEDHVTIIGTNTRGSFSYIYSYQLPNGISAQLSYQQYYSMDDVLLEDVGIQPDI